MAHLKLCRSAKKFIRAEKARIRREFSDLKERERKIRELYQRFLNKKRENNNKQNTKN